MSKLGRSLTICVVAVVIEGGLLDVVMPDVNYPGGYAEMLRAAGV